MASMHVLHQGLAALQLSASDAQITQLHTFINTLLKWNQAINLTAITCPKQAITHHLLDSLSIVPHIHGESLLDVGAGGGLPGIPLAIMRPNWQLTLIESQQKKVHFLQHVITSLQLSNVTAVSTRIENYKTDQQFSSIVSRAFSSLDNFIQLSRHLGSPETKFIAMKGRMQNEQPNLAFYGYTIEDIIQLDVPMLEQERCVVVVKNSAQ